MPTRRTFAVWLAAASLAVIVALLLTMTAAMITAHREGDLDNLGVSRSTASPRLDARAGRRGRRWESVADARATLRAMANAPVMRMTAAKYLAWEREAPARHEYVHGDVFCMAGGSPRHAALQGAMSGILWNGHRDGPCRVLGTDMRIVAEDGEHYLYADVSVVCGPSALAEGTEDVLTNPSIVVAVLSKSTEAYDRGRSGMATKKSPR